MQILKLCPIMLFALAFGAACNQDDSSPEPDDPDETKRTDTPDIFIQEKINIYESDIHYSKTDTVLTGNDIFISTPKDYESYKWWIGREDRFRSGRKTEIYFADPVRVKVRLYGTKENGGTDTLSRFLTVLNHPVVSLNKTTPLIDTFKGYNKSNPGHKFRVYFAKTQPIGFPDPTLWFFNLPEGCAERENVGIGVTDFSIGFEAMVFSSCSAGCNCVYGWVYLQENRQRIRAEYEYYKRPDSGKNYKVNKTFIGTKVE